MECDKIMKKLTDEVLYVIFRAVHGPCLGRSQIFEARAYHLYINILSIFIVSDCFYVCTVKP